MSQKPRTNFANVLIEGGVLSAAFVAGAMAAPSFVLGLLVVLYAVYYLYSRRNALQGKPIFTRAALASVGALIVAAAYGIGWAIRLMLRGV